MAAFSYQKGELYTENLPVHYIAQQVQTPFYCYAQSHILQQINAYQKAFRTNDLIAYALKANSNQAILSLIAKQNAGADIVSQGELRRALAAKFLPEKIIYSGVGKTVEDIDYALSQNIKCFNIESVEEFYQIEKRAKNAGTKAPISLRINPDVDAKTHEKIATGKAENKFGIPLKSALEIYKIANKSENIQIKGIDIHIGSQICSLEPFHTAFQRTNDFIRTLYQENIQLSHIDIGGGLGIKYKEEDAPPSIEDYALCAQKYFTPLNLDIICEPGRNIVGNAGILVTKVLYVKKTKTKNFIIVDAAMNDLIRPTLYNAWQEIIPIKPQENETKILADIVGPVCETGDYLGLDRHIIEPKPGDLLAIMSAGAYGAVMANNYNSRLLIPEILVHNKQYAIIRERPSYQQMIQQDKIPNWLIENS